MTRLREEKIEDLQRSRAKRRQEWKEVTIAIARSHGDERPGNIILQEAGQRAAVIGRAFSEAFRDRETTETVSQGDYGHKGTLLIGRGEVLTQARAMRYSHPALRIR